MTDEKLIQILEKADTPLWEARRAIEEFVAKNIGDNGIDVSATHCQNALVTPLVLKGMELLSTLLKKETTARQYVTDLKSEVDLTCIDCKDFRE